MRIDVVEFWAVMILIVAYIAAAFFRRGSSGTALYRKGLLHVSIAFLMMEVMPMVYAMIMPDRKPTDLLYALGVIVAIVAVLLFLNSLRLLCLWLLGEQP